MWWYKTDQLRSRTTFMVTVACGALLTVLVMEMVNFNEQSYDVRVKSELIATRVRPSSVNKFYGLITSCTEQKHLVFIKVHKAGSSSITNIIIRYGVSRNLTFALPKKFVIISFWQDQALTNIIQPPEGKSFDILCNHAVYSRDRMEKIMPHDTVYLTIVREPASLLQSAIYYFHSKSFPGEKNKLKAYINNPSGIRTKRLLDNTMSYELGLPKLLFNNTDKISEHLRQLDKEITVILVMERMEESLVLLRRLLCWKLEDILYIPRNINYKKPPLNLTKGEQDKLKTMMAADYMLYEFSVERLNRLIANQDDDFQDELMIYRSMLVQLREFCQPAEALENKTLSFQSTKWSETFSIEAKSCETFNMDGFQILRYVKHYQYPKPGL